MKLKKWSDFDIWRLVSIISLGIFTYFIIIILEKIILIKIFVFIQVFLWILAIFVVYSYLAVIMPSWPYITENGIFSGNVATPAYTKLKLKKATFLSWSEISEIRLIKRVIRPGVLSFLVTYLQIKSNSGEVYETSISDVNGFKQTLIKLRKNNLLKK